MCGIAGIIDFKNQPVPLEPIIQMGAALQHRGPENEGHFFHKNAAFVHRRLKIIDLETGDQPLFNKDRTIMAMLNGEIYNYQALRQELQQKGHVFLTQGDTEVLVHLYERHGDLSFLNQINGMFAFVIYDLKRELTWIARDRTGEKPLYYRQSNQGFSFASEIKALEYLSFESSPTVDLHAIDLYFKYGYIPAPLSIFKEIKKLEPGKFIRIEDRSVAIHRYWQVPWPNIDTQMSEASAFEEFKEIFSDAVKLRMVSDVPLGAFLSGGTDSSIVAALMQEHTQNRIQTFTIGFGQNTYDESPEANRVATALGTEHHTTHLDRFNTDKIPAILSFFGEPYADSSAIPTYYLCEAARKKITVALSGDGADEILGGYNRYVAAQMGAPYLRIPKALRPDLLLELFSRIPAGHQYYGKSHLKKAVYFSRFLSEASKSPENIAPFIFGDSQRNKLFNSSFYQTLNTQHGLDEIKEISKKYASLDLTTQMLWTDFQSYLPDDIHVKIDRMSMAHALEVRTPFMDHRLIEFLSRVPLRFKINKFNTKILLKKLLSQYLPNDKAKKKHGFEAPVAHWIGNELKPQINELFSGTYAKEYFNLEYIKKIFDLHENKKSDHSSEIWSLYVFLLWAQRK